MVIQRPNLFVAGKAEIDTTVATATAIHTSEVRTETCPHTYTILLLWDVIKFLTITGDRQ
ncbi:hypothetical protein ABIA27_004069 [Sinorhizobium fredii]